MMFGTFPEICVFSTRSFVDTAPILEQFEAKMLKRNVLVSNTKLDQECG